MSSLVIKLGSLLIKTLSKPIANRIKAQAREHERFRRICVQTAQAIHRWDMRFKLGLLQDTATIEKQIAREAAETQAKKHKHQTPTVKTEAQTKADEAAAAAKEKDKGKEPPKPLPKIRPLSEAKAIDSGANFVSETFLLLVGVALILGENWRQGRKASSRREDMAERLAEIEENEKAARRGMVELEREVIRLRAKENKNNGSQPRILPQKVWELEEKEEAEERPKPQSWTSWLRSKTGLQDRQEDPKPDTAVERPAKGGAEGHAPEATQSPTISLLDKILHPNKTNDAVVNTAKVQEPPNTSPGSPTDAKPPKSTS